MRRRPDQIQRPGGRRRDANLANTLRSRVHAILDQTSAGGQLGRVAHRVIIALILVNIVTVVLESVPSIDAVWHRVFIAIEIVSVTVFAAEYALRIWAAPEHPPLAGRSPMSARLRYALSPALIIDFLAILPLILALVADFDLRAFVVFRLIRYFKLARYSPGMTSLMEALFSERRALAACLVILFGAVLLAASGMHLAEGKAQPDKFGTIPDAMYWAVITLTTVGYGDVVPITPLGKTLAALTAITGLAMLALPVAIVSSAFAREIHRRDFVVTWSMVARVPLFSGLDAAAVAEIMRYLKSQTADAGEIIVRRGEPAHSMYFIAGGAVEIELPARRVVLDEGRFFGEIALLRKSERSGMVRALERTRLLVLEAHDLHVVMAAWPEIAARVEQVASERLAGEELSRGGDIVSEEIDSDGAPDRARTP